MSMTAAEALRSAEPPVDDGGIDQALAELDVKIWTWTDAMLSARAAIKRTLAHRDIFARGAEYSIGSNAAAAAEAPPQPAAGSTSQASPFFTQSFASGAQPEASAAAPVAPIASFNEPATAFGSSWGQAPAGNATLPGQIQQPAGPALTNPYAAPSATGEWAPTGAMQWPSADSSTKNSNSNSNSGEITPVAWPSVSPDNPWPTSDTTTVSQGAAPSPSSVAQGRGGERVKKTAPPRISPEETAARAARVAREEELLAALDETSARRVRLLRRLDPDADIEQLVEKASQQAQPRETEKTDKTDKTSSSWWRRK